MEKKSRLHLFEAFGVELEYMIVDKTTLDVRPIAEVLLRTDTGEIDGEAEHGDVAWSNELVSHVIEIKSNGPNPDLVRLSNSFQSNIATINAKLSESNAMLLSSAAHPWMSPATETKLWEHDSHEVYHLYDKIFNCKGHGWSNLQSTHINLPFYDDEEFSKLHTAIRFILPIIPAMTAASPVLNEKFTGYFDRRLYYYEKNQSQIPVLTGKVIPERIFTKHGYQKHIYDRIATAIEPHDPDRILNPIWLNSRGAIARFDRGAIEIRIIDIQECPKADVAIVALIVNLLKLLVSGKWISFESQKSFVTDDLKVIFNACVKDGSKAMINDVAYLKAFGYSTETKANVVWKDILNRVSDKLPGDMEYWKGILEGILENGTLAERIVTALGDDYSRSNIKHVYAKLAECLENNVLFEP
jgi:carboxylate-amine ligase